jgi:hypothetical protein
LRHDDLKPALAPSVDPTEATYQSIRKVGAFPAVSREQLAAIQDRIGLGIIS